jgi:hypothetical protein
LCAGGVSEQRAARGTRLDIYAEGFESDQRGARTASHRKMATCRTTPGEVKKCGGCQGRLRHGERQGGTIRTRTNTEGQGGWQLGGEIL